MAGCNKGNKGIRDLSSEFRRIAVRLDGLEVKVIRAKQRIKDAASILVSIKEKARLENRANDIIAEINRVEQRNAELERLAGL